MINDLFVNGTSVASGFGVGHERIAQVNKKSWIHYFAESTSASNLWNHSLISKPIQLTIEHTIGFCEQYLEQYKTFNNLFVICEMTMPQPIKWATVRSDKYDLTNYEILPIVIQREMHEYGQEYQSMFVRQERKINFLKDSIMYEYVAPKDIRQDDYRRHDTMVQNYYKDGVSNLYKRLVEAKIEIQYLQLWLSQRNIPYLLTWAAGQGDNYHNIVDRALKDVMVNKRLIPMKEFTCFSKGVEWSEKPFHNHPDDIGHVRISKFLLDWILKYNLLKPPITEFLNNK
jgi:hypothetical protein